MIRATGGVFIADLDPSDMTLACPDIPEAEANARLIAEAPAMLEALRELVETTGRLTGGGGIAWERATNARDAAAAVLRRIEGGQS